MSLERISACPICKSTAFIHTLTCKDYTVSQEEFELTTCKTCGFLFTNPRPDTGSIGKYYESKNYISHTGKSSGIIDTLYLLARDYTLAWKTRLIQQYHKPSEILDYGCGTGEFLHACVAKGWSGYGLEPSHTAQANTSIKNEVPVVQNLAELPNAQFDVITLWHVLEHVADLHPALTILKERLKNNGTLFVAVPNRTSYDASFYKENWAAYDVPRHLWHFTKDTMQELMNSLGLSIVKIRPMRLDAFYISLMSEKYQTGKLTIGGMARALRIAITSNIKGAKKLDHSSLIYIIKKK